MQMFILIIILFIALFLVNLKSSLSGKWYTIKDVLIDTTIETIIILFFVTMMLALSKIFAYYS